MAAAMPPMPPPMTNMRRVLMSPFSVVVLCVRRIIAITNELVITVYIGPMYRKARYKAEVGDNVLPKTG
jgi:hypothetical protein